MIFNNSSLSIQDFLNDYWQKKPLLIRQAFPDFIPELDANDVAGLACEEMAESRLISGNFPRHDWSLRQGPFREKELAGLPAENWTLLVQDVEKHYPPLQNLLAEFSFLPSWRFDDLMISVAAPGGSVGPHVDQYDVFLLQASGRRRWQIATEFDPALVPDCELNVLISFEPEQEWVLEPGDMLYLPPGVAHHGVALSEGMTWSVGMRAPSSADLLQAMGEWLASNLNEGERFRDGPLTTTPAAGEISREAVDSLRELLNRATGDESGYSTFIGTFLSRYRLAHEPAPPEQQTDPESLIGELNTGAILRHNPWTRLLWSKTEQGVFLFAAGEAFSCSEETARLICCDPVLLPAGDEPRDATVLACDLLNDGHLYLEN